ncbi:unnamed protein product, partial [Symbiodinium sp. CCMP2592]
MRPCCISTVPVGGYAPASVDPTSVRGKSGRTGTSLPACGATATASLFATTALLARRARAQCARQAAGEVFLEDLDRSDPGRSALRSEWAVAGEVFFEEVTEASGLVRVTGSGASNGGSWRRLRFNGNTEQSVLLVDASKTPEFGALAFGYLKSLAAVGTSTARALGRPETLRVLVIGVGLGALPGWFCKKMKATVDAVELDPAVLRAAAAIGGIPVGAVCDAGNARECAKDAAERTPEPGTLRVYCCDGAEYVVEAHQCKLRYDVVIVDVFDGQGETPQAFLEDRFGAALGGIAECAVANLTCPVPMWDEAHEFNAPEAGSLVSAWRRGFGVGAGVWSVRVAEGQNIIPAVTPVGRPPEEFLAQAARELAASGAFAFDPVKR